MRKHSLDLEEQTISLYRKMKSETQDDTSAAILAAAIMLSRRISLLDRLERSLDLFRLAMDETAR